MICTSDRQDQNEMRAKKKNSKHFISSNDSTGKDMKERKGERTKKQTHTHKESTIIPSCFIDLIVYKSCPTTRRRMIHLRTRSRALARSLYRVLVCKCRKQPKVPCESTKRRVISPKQSQRLLIAYLLGCQWKWIWMHTYTHTHTEYAQSPITFQRQPTIRLRANEVFRKCVCSLW